ncbi:hypothetical protein B0H67DRAFT_649976 [Lasiosphaeris hirsuta]|uniref:Tetratricopeptide repeat protein n=1 Tax=Lasiosphaeris hirsuta TaxID=260670 RepID=A0AA39ZXY1_9PEZI|nr:hypothetical protein B0H67DRAFT_649976 [Lasiosphaeris hirsuta]
MTHISLCLDTYMPACDFETDEAAATAKTALALTNFSGLKRLMPENPPRDLEKEMLLAKQNLVDVNTSESIMAYQLDLEGRDDDAIDQYKRCVAKNAEALDPKHSVNMATIHNLANCYDENDRLTEAKKLFDQSLELYHQDTHVVLRNIAYIRRRSSDPEGELECLKMFC